MFLCLFEENKESTTSSVQKHGLRAVTPKAGPFPIPRPQSPPPPPNLSEKKKNQDKIKKPKLCKNIIMKTAGRPSWAPLTPSLPSPGIGGRGGRGCVGGHGGQQGGGGGGRFSVWQPGGLRAGEICDAVPAPKGHPKTVYKNQDQSAEEKRVFRIQN